MTEKIDEPASFLLSTRLSEDAEIHFAPAIAAANDKKAAHNNNVVASSKACIKIWFWRQYLPTISGVILS